VKQRLTSILAVSGAAAAVLAGGSFWFLKHIAPKPIITVQLRSLEPQLTEIDLINQGAADAPLTAEVTATWDGDSAVTSSALSSYENAGGTGDALIFRPSAAATGKLHAGERLAVGWIRLGDGDSNLRAQITGGQSGTP
jgi:hypothetical protein